MEQTNAAEAYGPILDMPFPEVDPQGDEAYIKKLADEYVAKITAHKPAAVLCQGEMTLAFAVAEILMAEYDMTVLAACSERVFTERFGRTGEVIKSLRFRFVRFRMYWR
jgi:hypothetical protein